MSRHDNVFEETYHHYLDRIGRLNLSAVAGPLGIAVQEGAADIPLLDETFRVSAEKMADAAGNRPGFEACVILGNYLLRCPETAPAASDWVTYTGLKDSGPLTVYFKQNVEQAI